MATRSYYLGITLADVKDTGVDTTCIRVSHGQKAGMTAKQQSYCMVGLESLNYEKRLYYPCRIDATLSIQMSNGNAFPSIKTLKTWFLGATVNLTAECTGEKTHDVSNGYKVIDCIPTFISNGPGQKTTLNVRLRICSPDYVLDVSRYSKVHVAEKLGDIVRAEMETFDLEKAKEKEKYLVKHLPFLSYTRKRKNGKNTEDVPDELIQPYLVQYNETFYDFVRRTANRCGEFVYFENGKFHLGYDTTSQKSSVSISSYDSISFHNASGHGVDVKTFHRNAIGNVTSVYKFGGLSNLSETSEKDVTGFLYKLQNAYDEYLACLNNVDFDNWKDEWMLSQGKFSSDPLTSFLASPSLISAIVNAAWAAWAQTVTAKRKASDANTSFKKAYFDNLPYPADRYDVVEKSEDAPKTLSPFSTNPAQLPKQQNNEKARNIDSALMSLVHDVQVRLWNEAVDVDLGASITDLGLGHKITLTQNPGQVYIVVEVSGGGESDFEGGWRDVMRIKAVPFYNSNDTPPIPPAVAGGPIRVSGPQTAFVAKSYQLDDKRLGRVQIRYPWQASSTVTSPWVRVLTQLASHGGGNFCKPAENDEVLVDYEDGNIERPYVAGYLYNGDKSKTLNGTRSYSNVVSTESGTCMRMMESTDWSRLLTKVVPGLAILKAVPGVSSILNWNANGAASLLGMTEFTDAYGLYKVQLSSADRRISISSPFGQVRIGAFTGIEINAPHGDVRIKGKNVSFKAGNNISIESGLNIVEKTRLKNGKDALKATAKDLLLDRLLHDCIDLSFVRTILEMFLKPVGGTLKIKSHRFLLLEAGGATANIPVSAAARDYGLQWYNRDNPAFKESQLTQAVDKLVEIVNGIYDQTVQSMKAYAYNKAAYAGLANENNGNYRQDSAFKQPDHIYDDPRQIWGQIRNKGIQQIIDDYFNYPEAGGHEQVAREEIAQQHKNAIQGMADAVEAVNDVAVVLPANGFAFKKAIEAVFSNITTEDIPFHHPALNGYKGIREEDMENIAGLTDNSAKNRAYRMSGWKLLKQVAKELNLSIPADPEDDNLDTSANWCTFLEKVKPMPQADSASEALKGAWNALAGKALDCCTAPMKDHFSWGAPSGGKVLLSQIKGKTIHFDHGAFNQYDSSFLAKLKALGHD